MLIKEFKVINLGQRRLYLRKTERDSLGDKAVIMRKQKCLVFFSKEEWGQLVSEKLGGLEGVELLIAERLSGPKGIGLRRTQRALFWTSSLEKISNNGMVSIPPFLRGKPKTNPR